MAWHGEAWLGKARPDEGMAPSVVKDRRCAIKARLGLVWHGEARQGKARADEANNR